MPETKDTAEHKCMVCGVTSDQRVILSAENDGKSAWVCVRCLPQLIHGQH